MVTVRTVQVGIEFLGMVMLLKPVLPLGPVTVKDTVAVWEVWLVVMVKLEIWVLVMLPLIWMVNGCGMWCDGEGC